MEEKHGPHPGAKATQKDRSDPNDGSLSFQEEPTGLDRQEVASEGKEADPAHDSPRAAFTPGDEPHSRPAFAPRRISKTTLAVLALVLLLMALLLVL